MSGVLVPGWLGCVGSGAPGACGAGRLARAESAQLAELHWPGLEGSAGLSDLRVTLAESRGPARVTGSIVASACASA